MYNPEREHWRMLYLCSAIFLGEHSWMNFGIFTTHAVDAEERTIVNAWGHLPQRSPDGRWVWTELQPLKCTFSSSAKQMPFSLMMLPMPVCVPLSSSSGVHFCKYNVNVVLHLFLHIPTRKIHRLRLWTGIKTPRTTKPFSEVYQPYAKTLPLLLERLVWSRQMPHCVRIFCVCVWNLGPTSDPSNVILIVLPSLTLVK